MRTIALLALLLAAAMPLRATATPEAACPPPDDIDLDSAPLPHLAGVLKPNGKLNVLAVGSAVMQGQPPETAAAGAGPQAAAPLPSFPWQMARALEASVHGLRVTMTVRGGRLLAAADMGAIIRAELGRGAYQLVLWQTGTVDAVRDASPGDFYQALADGAAAVADAGADLVLVDPQYSRFLEANANMQPYLGAMQAVGAMPGVVLFHRYELMRDWADAGAIDLERTAKPARAAAAARLQTCLGRELARMLLADIAAAE